MKKILQLIFWFFAGIMIFSFLVSIVGVGMMMSGHNPRISEASILQMDLEGIIMDGSEFLAKLRQYGPDEKIKGVLVMINSPGGAVGPSQEIYSELKYI